MLPQKAEKTSDGTLYPGRSRESRGNGFICSPKESKYSYKSDIGKDGQ